MKRIVYVSKAVNDFDNSALFSLLEECKNHNSQKDITGALLYSAGNFIQMLEGDESDLDNLYAAIIRDPRHTQVRTLYDGSCEERVYPKWWMAFFNVDERKDLPTELKLKIETIITSDEKQSEDAVAIFQQFQSYFT